MSMGVRSVTERETEGEDASMITLTEDEAIDLVSDAISEAYANGANLGKAAIEALKMRGAVFAQPADSNDALTLEQQPIHADAAFDAQIGP